MSPSDNRDASIASTQRGHGAMTVNKVAKPDYYHGERNKLDDWVNQMSLFFLLEGIGVEKQPLTAASFLRGEAQHWIRPRLTEYLLDRTDEEGLFSNWKSFVKVIRNVYGLSNDKQVAIRMIQHLTQKSSASQYTAKFQEYSSKTDWDDNALMTMYYRGLKDSVKDELMRHGGDQSTLDGIIRSAIEVDDALYERFMEKRHTGQYRGRTGYATGSRSAGQQRRDPDAMELDSTQQRPRRGKDGGRGRQHASGKKRNGPECYNCHKIGHYAKDCRGKKMRPQQEVNVILTKDDDSPTDKNRGAYDTTGSEEEPDNDVLYGRFSQQDYIRQEPEETNTVLRYPRKPRKEVNVVEKNSAKSTLTEVLIKQYQELNDYHDELMEHDNWDQEHFNLMIRTADQLADLSDRIKASVEEEEEGQQPEELQKKPRKEFNMMSKRQPLAQRRDDGNAARGRSPPPFIWEDTELQENQIPSPTMEYSRNSHSTEPTITITGPQQFDSVQSVTVTQESEESQDEESSDDDYSDDDEPDDQESTEFTVSGPEPLKKIVLHFARRYEEVFPVVQGKRRLHPHEFDEALAELRTLFWRYRKVNVNYDAYTFVQEQIPLGSTFHGNHGFIAPDGLRIPNLMRERVKTIQTRYREFQFIQGRYYDDEITQEELARQAQQSLDQWALVTPSNYLLPVNRLMILGHIKTTTRGPIIVRQSQGKITIKPREGPLSWEVCLEDANSPTYFSKN